MPGDDRIQSEGREKNAALPLNESDNKGGPERYPSVRQDDGVEQRSFDPANQNPEPPQGAGDSSVPPSSNEGHTGPGGDPAEGKR